MLEACLNGASKTIIVYGVNLNFKTVVPYIELLREKDLLEVIEESPTTYRTTKNGIKMMESMKNVLNEFYG